MFIDSLFSLAFASRFVVLSLLFELTSFLLRFLSFSSSAILFSMFNPRGRFTVIWDCYLKSGSTSFAIYFAFNFGFIFVLSLVNTLLFVFITEVFTGTIPLLPQLGSRPSAHSAVSSPTSFIVQLQTLMSTNLFYLIYILLHLNLIKVSMFFYKTLVLYFGFPVVSFRYIGYRWHLV